jgi:hypothetical protein
MAQPKKPPISIRLPDALLAEVDAWAAEQGMARNAAIKALIDFGLGVKRAPAEPLRPKVTPAPAKPAAKAEPAPKAEFKSRLKGQWKAP